MTLFYQESEKLQIKLQTLESLAAYIDPVLHILSNMIASGNEGLIQFIGGDQQFLTNDVKKVVSMLDIRSGFFKEFISSPIAASKLQCYVTEYAYVLCRLVRDFGDVSENYSILERLEMIKSGEQIIYQEMKNQRLTANLDAIPIYQVVNYSELLSSLYDSYFKLKKELFKKGQYQINFVNAKSSFGEFSFSFDSYLLEICKGRNLSYFSNFKIKDEIDLESIILCDYHIESKDFTRNSSNKNQQIPLKDQSQGRQKPLLILTTSVLSEIEIDSLISCRQLQNVLIVSNVSLKVLREISFVFGLQVKQSPTQVIQLFKTQSNIETPTENDKTQWKAQLLRGESSELNRSSSELEHLGERQCLQLSCTNVGTEQSILSVVISVPTSVKHYHNRIVTNIRKEIDKLSSILRHEKVVIGGGQFESTLGKTLRNVNQNKNIFLNIFSGCLIDYSNIVKKGLERRQVHVNDKDNDGEQQDIDITLNKHETDKQIVQFYDDYKMKKSLISSSIQILKRVQLTPLELTYQPKIKQDAQI